MMATSKQKKKASATMAARPQRQLLRKLLQSTADDGKGKARAENMKTQQRKRQRRIDDDTRPAPATEEDIVHSYVQTSLLGIDQAMKGGGVTVPHPSKRRRTPPILITGPARSSCSQRALSHESTFDKKRYAAEKKQAALRKIAAKLKAMDKKTERKKMKAQG
jgi:hypothetical protein